MNFCEGEREFNIIALAWGRIYTFTDFGDIDKMLLYCIYGGRSFYIPDQINILDVCMRSHLPNTGVYFTGYAVYTYTT